MPVMLPNPSLVTNGADRSNSTPPTASTSPANASRSITKAPSTRTPVWALMSGPASAIGRTPRSPVVSSKPSRRSTTRSPGRYIATAPSPAAVGCRPITTLSTVRNESSRNCTRRVGRSTSEVGDGLGFAGVSPAAPRMSTAAITSTTSTKKMMASTPRRRDGCRMLTIDTTRVQRCTPAPEPARDIAVCAHSGPVVGSRTRTHPHP